MKRPSVVAVGGLLVALLGIMGVAALRPVDSTGPAGPTYTVAQVTAGLRQHPRQWANRTVLVRGMIMGWSINFGGGARGGGTPWQGTLLLDQQFFPSLPQKHVPPMLQPTPAGRVLLNARGLAPTLLLLGLQPVRRSLMGDVGQWVALSVARLLGGLRRSNAYAGQGVPAPRVYRVQLLAPARCAAPLVATCYTAVVR